MGLLTIVLGLGNPGEAYRATRHNLGFWTVDLLADRCGATLRAAGELRRHAWAAPAHLAGRDVVLAEPRTYMNRSGRAAAALARAYGTSPADLLVIHDDADLELGRIRVRWGGGAGGHNGIRSLIEVLGESEFARVRLGVRGDGREDRELADYVLSPFLDEEMETARALARLGADAVESLLERGLEETMNRFNGVSVAPVADDEANEP